MTRFKYLVANVVTAIMEYTDIGQELTGFEILVDKDFQRFSDFIYNACGIKITEAKRIALETKLRKRLRALGIDSFRKYYEYLLSPDGVKHELLHMIDCVTTNKTDFFREPGHFDYLVGTAIYDIMDSSGGGTERDLTIWSAGCSTGEEPYTIAMLLNEFQEKYRGFRYSIFASDISWKALNAAQTAIYEEERVEPVPYEMKKKYLMRSKDKTKRLVRIVPELRNQVRFRRLNFMDGDYNIPEPLDIIFCRNVMIYFDRETQGKLMKRFHSHLNAGGYIFIGHSETLHGLNLPLLRVSPTIYKKAV